MTSTVNEITSVLLKEVKEKPFAFFAHSLGTYMSLAIALHLKKKYGLEPVHLFMSAAHAPNSAVHLGLKSMALPDENNEFLACMEMLPHNEDVRENMVVTSREDTRVLQIFFLQELASGDTSFYELPGDHLYLLRPSSESLLTKHITRCIENAGL